MLLSAVEFSLACSAITLGAILQASTGLGAGLVVVPLLALIDPGLIPGPVVFASLGLSGVMAYQGRKHINFVHMDALLIGIVLGSVLGAWLLSRIRIESLGVFFGVFIITAVAVSLTRLRIRASRQSAFVTGSLSAFMGLSAGVGAPLLALFYQYEEGQRLRATLAFIYLIATVIMLATLNRFAKFGTLELQLGVQLVPGFVLGYWLAGRAAAVLDRGYSRAAVLILSLVSALTLIGRGIA
ncbi:MAG: sulfite exporter TauE/SafE family protein [Candidatus Competibacteraceae bacterium]